MRVRNSGGALNEPTIFVPATVFLSVRHVVGFRFYDPRATVAWSQRIDGDTSNIGPVRSQGIAGSRRTTAGSAARKLPEYRSIWS